MYVDDLIAKLRCSGFGIHGYLFCGCIFYADDIALLSCSCYGLRKLLDICSAYGEEWDIKFNPEKKLCWAVGDAMPPDEYNSRRAMSPFAKLSHRFCLKCSQLNFFV